MVFCPVVMVCQATDQDGEYAMNCIQCVYSFMGIRSSAVSLYAQIFWSVNEKMY